MKKINITILIVLLSLLTGCKSTSNNIPFIIYDEKDLFMSEFKKAIDGLEHGDINITTYDSKNSQIIQNEIINSSLEDEPALMIINPVDRLGAYTIIEKLKENIFQLSSLIVNL